MDVLDRLRMQAMRQAHICTQQTSDNVMSDAAEDGCSGVRMKSGCSAVKSVRRVEGAPSLLLSQRLSITGGPGRAGARSAS